MQIALRHAFNLGSQRFDTLVEPVPVSRESLDESHHLRREYIVRRVVKFMMRLRQTPKGYSQGG